MFIDSVLEAVTNVRLIQFKMMSSGNVFANVEFVNPSRSIKDRVAQHIIESAEEIGKLKPEIIILNKRNLYFSKIGKT